MSTSPPIELQAKPIAPGHFPLVCTPLVGRTTDAIMAELQVILPKQPDVLEWRVDFFEDIGNSAAVVALAQAIRQAAPHVLVMFTRRSTTEGGEAIALSEEQVIALYEAVCKINSIDLIDYEMSHTPAHIAQVRAVSRVNGVQLVLSSHDFVKTPSLETLNQKFLHAQQQGADVAKVAVMPNNMDDVLTLLTATRQSSQLLSIPLISLSMGPYGALTRLLGWTCGSALTFAVGSANSAPGQIPMEDINTVMAIVRKSMVNSSHVEP